MRLIDNNHHEYYQRFYNYKYFKVNCKVKTLKKMKKFLLLFFNLNTPYQLFFRKISVAVLTPLLNSSKRSIARGDTGREGGIFKYFSFEYQ